MVFDVDGPIEFEVSIGKNFILFVLGNPIKWTKVNWLYDGGMQKKFLKILLQYVNVLLCQCE